MAVSNVTIANRALTLLSADRIQALNDTSEQARKINAIFDDTRDAMLEEHNWNFARKQRELAVLSDAPVLDGWSYEYQLPSDCIRVTKLEGDYPYAVYGNKLYTNSDDPRIEYVSRETDPTKFSSGFVKAFASRLAADLAFGITQNATFAANMDAVAQRDLKEAKWSDAQEGSESKVVRGSMIQGT
jgi:hypothetical protein